jgi:hypothetical protein
MAQEQIKNDFIKKIVKDPSAPPDVLMLTGFLGDSSEEGHTRLYFDTQLSTFVEIPNDAILHVHDLPKDQSPLGEKYVWIQRDAMLVHGKVGPERMRAKFLEGPIAQAFAGAAAGGTAVLPTIFQSCPGPATLACPSLACPTQANCPSVACPTLAACPSLICPTQVACPTQANCPSVACPTLAACPSLICPTQVACPTQANCPSVACPTLAACPSLACPTLACPTLGGCPTFGGCPSVACGPQQPGYQQQMLYSGYPEAAQAAAYQAGIGGAVSHVYPTVFCTIWCQTLFHCGPINTPNCPR